MLREKKGESSLFLEEETIKKSKVKYAVSCEVFNWDEEWGEVFGFDADNIWWNILEWDSYRCLVRMANGQQDGKVTKAERRGLHSIHMYECFVYRRWSFCVYFVVFNLKEWCKMAILFHPEGPWSWARILREKGRDLELLKLELGIMFSMNHEQSVGVS